jgi:hypothetical protein
VRSKELIWLGSVEIADDLRDEDVRVEGDWWVCSRDLPLACLS